MHAETLRNGGAEGSGVVAWRVGLGVAVFVRGEVGRGLVTEFAGLDNAQGHCVSSVGDVGEGRFSMAW